MGPEKITVAHAPHDDVGATETLEDFPKGAQILSSEELLDAIEIWKEKGMSGIPTASEIVLHLQPTRPVCLGDFFESLRRVDENTRESVFKMLHAKTKSSFGNYHELWKLLQKKWKAREKCTFTNIAATLKKNETSIRQFVRKLGYNEVFGFPARRIPVPESRSSNRTQEDPGAKLRSLYVQSIRELVDMREEINPRNLAGRLRINGVYNISANIVEIFLAQSANKDLVENVLKGKV